MDTFEIKQTITGLIEALEPFAKKTSEVNGRTIPSNIASTIRNHVMSHYSEPEQEALKDNREKQWNVRIGFTCTFLNGEVELISLSEVELVTGFNEIYEMILDYVDQTHTDEQKATADMTKFQPAHLKKRLGGMRPAISRGRGKAMTSIRYMIGVHLYTCNVQISKKEIKLD